MICIQDMYFNFLTLIGPRTDQIKIKAIEAKKCDYFNWNQ